jgi:SAM-dependent methyltransferase
LNTVLRHTPRPLRAPAGRMAVRAYEAYLASRGRRSAAGSAEEGAGAWPVPPARLRVKVSWTADLDFFLDSGRGQVQFIRELAARHDAPVEEMEALLDFGCGCGRLARWWSDLGGVELHGSDHDPELVDWCSRNLPFLRAAVNRLEPPLAYGKGRFDLIYALSVFTHLPAELQQRWLTELVRALRPGGLLFFTVMGTRYVDQLSPHERARFDRGEPVTQFEDVAGTNLCSVYHPPRYVESSMLDGLQLLESVHPGRGDVSAPGLSQDSYLVRIPGES